LFTVTVMVAVCVLPAMSDAVAVMVCDAFEYVAVSILVLYGTLVSVLTLMPSTLNTTLRMPLASDAVAETVTVPEMVEPSEGEVIDTVGGVVSEEGGGVVVENAPRR